MCRSDPSFISPIPSCRSSPTHSPLFHLPSFVLPRFVWFYVFFARGQVLLPTLSWSSARSSVSGGIFLLYTWREMHSMSTYSSTILDLRCLFFFFQLSCMKLYILEINLSLVASFANIFSHSVDCCFHFLYGFLCCANLL